MARREHGCDGRGAARDSAPRPSHPCSERATLASSERATLRVTDTIELTTPAATVRRMSFGTDHEAAYVAAGGVYQQSVLGPWTDLSHLVAELNERRRVTIVREW